MISISDTQKDKNFESIEIVKKYFLRIFSVLSKEVRQKFLDLNLSKEELKEVKRELAFLPEDKQIEYLEELTNNID